MNFPWGVAKGVCYASITSRGLLHNRHPGLRVFGGDLRFCSFGADLRGVPIVEPRSQQTTRPLPANPTHCRAICREIGARLRIALDRDQSPVPSRLRGVLERFEEMDARARLQSFSRINSTVGYAWRIRQHQRRSSSSSKQSSIGTPP